MATTDVDICNAALVKIGKPAAITSLTDGSVAANTCAAVYSISLNTLLAEHQWSFATVTALLSLLDNPNSLWGYCYQTPGDLVTPLAVFEYDARGDVMGNAGSALPLMAASYQSNLLVGLANVTQQDYSLESDAAGNAVIYSNQPNAMLKYVRFITSAASLPPMFVQAFACMLASQLAGAMLKGDVGVVAMEKILQAYDFWLAKAKAADGMRRVVHPRYVPGAIGARY